MGITQAGQEWSRLTICHTWQIYGLAALNSRHSAILVQCSTAMQGRNGILVDKIVSTGVNQRPIASGPRTILLLSRVTAITGPLLRLIRDTILLQDIAVVDTVHTILAQAAQGFTTHRLHKSLQVKDSRTFGLTLHLLSHRLLTLRLLSQAAGALLLPILPLTHKLVILAPLFTARKALIGMTVISCVKINADNSPILNGLQTTTPI